MFRRGDRLILIAILLVSFALRFCRLDYHSLRGDEASTFVFSTDTLANLIPSLKTVEFNPPLYFTLMHAWITLGGDTEYALRFPAAIFGVLLVAATASLGRVLFDARLGVAVGLLIAINPYQVFYAQDARSYPLVTLLGVLSTISLLHALRRGNTRAWIVYAILVLGAIYTHYYAALIVAFQSLFIMWDSWRRRRFPWQYITVGIVDGLLFLPWFLSILKLLLSYRGYGETLGIADSFWRPLTAFAGGLLLGPEIAWVNTLVIPPLFCLGVIGLWNKHRSAALLAVLYLSVPLMGVYVASRFRPVFDERYLILASPAFYLLICTGLVWLFGVRRAGLTAIATLLATAWLATGGLALYNYYYNPQFAKSPPWRDVLDYIGHKAHPGDALIYTAPLPTILYYNANRLPAYLVIPRGPETSLSEAVEQIKGVFDHHPRVWLIPAAPDDWPASHQVEPWLDRHSLRLDQTFFRVLHIGLYQAPNAFQETMTPQTAAFSDGLRLNGFRLAERESPLVVQAGEEIPLTLVWYTERPPTLAYTVFTHLVGLDGTLWGQWDNPPVWGSYPTTEWAAGETVFDQYLVPVKDAAPPGKYRLLVGFYDPVTGARLPVLDAQGHITGDSVQLDQAILIQARGN